jgi:hypothetical protein
VFVADFARQLTLELALDPPLAADEAGNFYLGIGPHLPIVISPYESGLAMRADLGSCPEEGSARREELFKLLLLANLLGQGTGRAVLGLDERGEQIRLLLALPYEVPYSECRDHLEGFLNFAEYWYRQLEDFKRA